MQPTRVLPRLIQETQMLHPVVGPPGCGKSTFLAHEAVRAIEKYSPSEVVAFSLTRTAANVIRNKAQSIPEGNAKTLHGHCYGIARSAGMEIARLKDWNEHAPHDLRLSDGLAGGKHGAEEDVVEAACNGTLGDRWFRLGEALRHRRIPRDQWPTGHEEFWEPFDSWKEENGLVDFTGMIEHAADGWSSLPGASVILGDEIQDCSPLEFALIHQWDENAAHTVLVGDPYQALYLWRAAAPEELIAHGDKIRVLRKSYRVPQAVHAKAADWISRSPGFQPFDYSPTEVAGQVHHVDIRLRQAGMVVDLALAKAGEVMILATCAYMLNGVVAELKSRGIPFHNPYRRHETRWNPLSPSPRGISTAQRTATYLKPDCGWSREDIEAWTAHLAATVFRKKAVQDGTFDSFKAAFKREEDLADAMIQDPEWLWQNVIGSKRDSYAYPARVAAKCGRSALTDKPRLIIGTVHSAKGGECDHVILAPDLSPAAFRELNPWGEAGDPRGIWYAFYVGMTRARQTLTILLPSTSQHVEI